MLKYDSLEQLRMRLEGTIITYHDKAYTVVECSDGGSGPTGLNVFIRGLTPTDGTKRPNGFWVDADDDDLNFRRFSLGYINVTAVSSAYFLTRATVRQQQQGLSPRTIHPNIGNNSLYSTDLDNVLFNRYPTVEEAFDRINNQGWQIVGISRDLAVGRDADITQLRTLLYRGRRVGIALGSKFSHFLVDPKDKYLTEVLTENNFPFEFDEEDEQEKNHD